MMYVPWACSSSSSSSRSTIKDPPGNILCNTTNVYKIDPTVPHVLQTLRDSSELLAVVKKVLHNVNTPRGTRAGDGRRTMDKDP